MGASKTRPASVPSGSCHHDCIPHPSVHRFRYGSPGPSRAPSFVPISAASGHVRRIGGRDIDARHDREPAASPSRSPSSADRSRPSGRLCPGSPSSPGRPGTGTSDPCRRESRRSPRDARRRPSARAARSPTVSEICARPSAATISSAERPESYIFANTSLATVLLIVPCSTIRMRPASAVGDRGTRSTGMARSFIVRSTSPMTQLLAALALPAAVAVASK